MFFPTSEGFYDFRKKQYIYQYKDQVGNVRLSYWVHPDEQTLKVLDYNDYYPFGMNISQNSEFSATTSPLNYKFQEQELQETGFYSFKWRNYMPDVGRFFGIDPLSEKYAYQSHYNFSENRVTDYRELEGLEGVDIHWDGYDHNHGDFWNAINFNWSLSFSWGGNDNSASNNVDNSSHDGNLDVGYPEPVGEAYGEPTSESNFAEVGALTQVGEGISWAELGEGVKIGAELRVLSAAGLWALPLLLNGDTSDAPSDIADTNQYITLYRGVSSNAKGSMYEEAMMGTAIPNGLRPGQIAHSSMDDHAMGDNYSIWTSWTKNPSVAKDFATNYGEIPGVILSQKFKLGQAIPNISETAKLMQEGEWLVTGPVMGAQVQHIKP